MEFIIDVEKRGNYINLSNSSLLKKPEITRIYRRYYQDEHPNGKPVQFKLVRQGIGMDYRNIITVLKRENDKEIQEEQKYPKYPNIQNTISLLEI